MDKQRKQSISAMWKKAIKSLGKSDKIGRKQSLTTVLKRVKSIERRDSKENENIGKQIIMK